MATPRLVREALVPNRQLRAFWVAWGTVFAFKVSLIMTIALTSQPERERNLERHRDLAQCTSEEESK